MKTINTTGELGTMANWQQHNYTQCLFIPGKEFEKIIKQRLPASCWPSGKDLNINRLIVPTVRTTLRKGEDLKLKVIITGDSVSSAKLFWKPIGNSEYSRIDLKNTCRSVWQVSIPAKNIPEDFEYFIEARSLSGIMKFPATHPERDQTVVVY